MLPSSERLKHPDEWVGEELCGKWRIEELVGVGGMASVYAATAWDGSRVAIKLLHTYYADDDDVRMRFLREGYAANRVKHPAVISASADGVTPCGLPFLVLDLLDGVGLDAVQDELGTLPSERVLRIADQVLDALAAAHDIGILHRDLKPDNLVIDDQDNVSLVDFGIAYLDDRGPGPRMTVQGCPMGTPGFMAPEQARGEWDEVDATTDLWALGATMFTLLTGREVFMGPPNMVLVASMTRRAPPIQEVMPEVPRAVAAIIDRALAFSREERWQSARIMQLAVRQALGIATSRKNPTLAPVAGVRTPHRTRASWKPFVAAAAGAMAIALAGSTDYLRPHLGELPRVRPVLAATLEAITSAARASESEPAAPCDTASGQIAPEPASCRPSPDACRQPCPARDSSPHR